MPLANASKTSHSGRWFTPMFWCFPAFLLGISIMLAASGERGRLAFRFDREALTAGEWWRAVTGHFVHLGWQHLALNGAGLLLVWFLTGSRFRLGQWIVIAAVVIAGIDAGFWWLSPDLSWYVGLSGLLHGLLFAGLVAGLRGTPVESAILLVVLSGKLALEQWSGPLPGSVAASGGPVVVDAHLFGSIAGLVAAMPFLAAAGRPWRI